MKSNAGYKWIVKHPDLLEGQPTVKGTRLSVAFILNCLSQGMTAKEISKDYSGFPQQSLQEILRFAAKRLENDATDLAA